MPMPAYPVHCYSPRCGALARFKIASKWHDGQTCELKTYFLSCEKCLSGLLKQAREKQQRCRLMPGESLDEPGVYELQSACNDRQRVRRSDLEACPEPEPMRPR